MEATDSGANFALRAFSISATRNTQGAAPVTATRTALPVSATNTPTIAYREAGFLNFIYAARFGHGKLTDVMISPGSSAVSYIPLKN